MYLIAGLGNPTREYEKTRHNVGFSVIDVLADKYNIDVSDRKHKALCGRGVIEGEKVQLVGFGSFEVKTRAARVGRNPKTGEEIPISEARLPVFKAGKALKDAVAK